MRPPWSWQFLRVLLGASTVVLQIQLATAAPEPVNGLPDGRTVVTAMERANHHFMAEWPVPGCKDCLPGKHPSNIWTRAVYFEGALALYRINKDPSALKYAVDWGTFHDWQLRKGDGTQSADDQCAGQAYIELYQLDPSKPERIAHIRANLDQWTASKKVSYYTWIDALQMSMPNFAKLGVLDGNPAHLETMYAAYDHAKTTLGLYNPADHLWWRDAKFKPPFTTPNGKPCYWSRGNGWVFAALVRVLDILPKTDPHRAEYETTFREMASALLPLQREDGFWNTSLADPDNFGGPETTGTSLFLYGFAWGVREGLLPADIYVPAITKAWNAVGTRALHPDGFLGYVQGTGSKPSDGQPVTYDSVPDFDDFGLGCFLLGGSEVYALVSAAPRNSGAIKPDPGTIATPPGR